MFFERLFRRFKKKPPVNRLSNQRCYDKYGRFLGWYSRSVSCVMFVFCKDSYGEWCVLGSERGPGVPDYSTYWNVPCGYLDYNETTKECAVRECFEETGVYLENKYISFIGFNDSPGDNKQNVSFRYVALIDDKKTDDFKFSKVLNEKDEVGEIKWIRINDIYNHNWAFGHDKLILEIFNYHLAAAKL